MSLGIFSFDLAAIINSLSNFIDISETAVDEPSNADTSLEKTSDILQNQAISESGIDDKMMAAALDNAVTAVIAQNEPMKKETIETKIAAPPPIRLPSITLGEETKKEIEQLIRSLQTSVVHSYQSTDIIDETVSHNNAANFSKRKIAKDTENNRDNVQEVRKREESKFQRLRDQLKKEMLKNNSDV